MKTVPIVGQELGSGLVLFGTQKAIDATVVLVCVASSATEYRNALLDIQAVIDSRKKPTADKLANIRNIVHGLTSGWNNAPRQEPEPPG